MMIISGLIIQNQMLMGKAGSEINRFVTLAVLMKVHLRDVERQGLSLLVAAPIVVVGVRMSKLPVVTVSVQLKQL